MNSSGRSSRAPESTNTNVERIGIIGGSGLCALPELENVVDVPTHTRYGYPSAKVHLGTVAGHAVAFMPRHGTEHTIPPHKVNYKANLQALKQFGVQKVIATCIAGSLNRTIVPGSLVVPDQFVNLTWGRDDTFEQDGTFVHLPMAEPYCPMMRDVLVTHGANEIKNGGTVVVIQGPRFSTIAESRWFMSNGWDLVNMTQYPECYFARELGLCYAVVAGITDFDVGLANLEDIQKPEHLPQVLARFQRCCELTRQTIVSSVRTLAEMSGSHCQCGTLTAPYYRRSL